MHFQRIAPTWLLLELDWASTGQAKPFMSSCSDIVAIDHVKWIEGSKHTGKTKAPSSLHGPALRGSRPPPSPSNHFASSAELPEWKLALFIALPITPLDSVATRLRNAA